MQFSVTAVQVCAGGNHFDVTFNVTEPPLGVVVVQYSKEEFQAAAPNGKQEARDTALILLRSAILTAGANTLPQVRAALIGKTYKL